jgi:fructokinase
VKAGRLFALHVGTLGLVVEPMASAIEQAVAVRDRDTLVFVDPNCRGQLIPDRDAYIERLRIILAQADIVKASEEDLAFLWPGSAPAEAAARLLQAGPGVALITQGARGAVVVTAGWTTRVPAPPVLTVDTVGAGDTFGVAWLACWHTLGLAREALGDCARLTLTTEFACRVASIACSRRGSAPPRIGEDALSYPANPR